MKESGSRRAHTVPLKGGDEYDALTRARRYYVYLDRPGACRRAKRKYNKRQRRHFKFDQEVRAA